MHDLNPVFNKFSYSVVMKELASKICRFVNPVVVQSMYIFKNPRIGGEVFAHKDSSFLTTWPHTCQGIWVALDDATIENGCMWGVPGSHARKPNQYMQLLETPEQRGTHFTPEQEEYEYTKEGGVPLEVKAGGIVILHGEFLHYSEKNRHGDNQRHAYTLHVVDQKEGIEWDNMNWIQRPMPGQAEKEGVPSFRFMI